MKVSKHALARAVERQGVPGKKRKRRQKIDAAVKEALRTGIVCADIIPWQFQVIHPDGRRWIVDMRTKTVITTLPSITLRMKGGPK
jgi:hypothetical protein